MAKSGVLRNAVRADPWAEDRESTALLSRVGRLQGSGKTCVCLSDGTEVLLSASLVKVLQFSADELADGNAVTILSLDVVLSQTEAADLLGLSQQFLVRLLDDGSIPSQTQPHTRHCKVLFDGCNRVSRAAWEKACGAPADHEVGGRERASVLTTEPSWSFSLFACSKRSSVVRLATRSAKSPILGCANGALSVP